MIGQCAGYDVSSFHWFHLGCDYTRSKRNTGIRIQLLFAITGFDGRVVIGSWYGDRPAHLRLGGPFHRSRMRLISSQVSTIAPRFARRWSQARRREVAWRMLAETDPARLITHRFPVSRADEAYDLLDRRPQEAVQVMLTY